MKIKYQRFYPWPPEVFKYLGELFHSGLNAGNPFSCSGMYPMSIINGRYYYDAAKDELLKQVIEE